MCHPTNTDQILSRPSLGSVSRKWSRNSHAILCYRFATIAKVRYFRCSHCEKSRETRREIVTPLWLFVSETRENWSREYLVSVSRCSPKRSRLLIGPAHLLLLTVVFMSPAAAAAMKHTLALYVGLVYWFAPRFSSKQLASQLWPMSGLFLLYVYATHLGRHLFEKCYFYRVQRMLFQIILVFVISRRSRYWRHKTIQFVSSLTFYVTQNVFWHLVGVIGTRSSDNRYTNLSLYYIKRQKYKRISDGFWTFSLWYWM